MMAAGPSLLLHWELRESGTEAKREKRRESFLRPHLWHGLHRVLTRYRALRYDRPTGFTLLEMLVVTVILGTVSSMAAPPLQRVRERAMIGAATAELRILSAELLAYIEINFQAPASLASIGRATLLDPWGNPYYYTNLAGAGPGSARKNKFMVPLNTDFDLYSSGADGQTKLPLTAKVAKDDVLRALDGGFFGSAADF